MKKKDLVDGLLIGLFSGWIVVVFSELYFEAKSTFASLFSHNPIVVFIINASLPLIGFLIIIDLVLLSFRFRKG